jgi:hypothetical protein
MNDGCEMLCRREVERSIDSKIRGIIGRWNGERVGESHTSAISKQDLTVVTAGICLDDLDEEFDLQSLVGVVEQRYD